MEEEKEVDVTPPLTNLFVEYIRPIKQNQVNRQKLRGDGERNIYKKMCICPHNGK